MGTIEKNNRMIAEFMGVKPKMESPDVYTYSDGVFFMCRENNPEKVMDAIAGYVKYHTSWDWLMPVVEKIESFQDGKEGDAMRCHLYDVEIRQHSCIIESVGIEMLGFHSKIEATYFAIVAFIEWYNENK